MGPLHCLDYWVHYRLTLVCCAVLLIGAFSDLAHAGDLLLGLSFLPPESIPATGGGLGYGATHLVDAGKK